MKIGIDARELTKNKAGKGWYVYHVLKNILSFDHSNKYLLYSNQEIDFPDYENIEKIVSNEPDLLWHFAMPNRLKKDKVDIYWAPTSPIVPALANTPTIFTIHDLTNLLFPETHMLKGRLIEKIFLGKAIRKSKKIIAVSEATKQDIIKFFPDSKNKISVTLLGYDQSFKPLTKEEVENHIKKYNLEPGYILFVGTLEPRKNIESIVKAYTKINSELQKQHPLIIAGKKGWKYESILEAIGLAKTEGKIRLLEYVPFEDLPALYNGASIFVFPSLYEGFGLPPLEAMACGTPVVTSNISSLPEVVGDAGLQIEPRNTEQIKEKIEELLTNKEFYQKYSQLSLEQATKFSWQKTADSITKCFYAKKN